MLQIPKAVPVFITLHSGTFKLLMKNLKEHVVQCTREQWSEIQPLFNMSFRLRRRKELIFDLFHFFYVSQHYFQRSPFRQESYNIDTFLKFYTEHERC